MKPEHGMSVIVKTVTRWLVGFIFLFGLYVALYGHISPGGGFPGGVIIACTFILITLAAGKEFSLRILSLDSTSMLDSLGAFLFLFIGLCGITYGGVFLANFLPLGTPFHLDSAGTIVFSNLAIGIKVGAAVFAAFMLLSMFRPEEDIEE